MSKLLLLSALLGLSLSPSGLAQTAAPLHRPDCAALTPQAALTRLATATRVDASWFIPAFASALPQVLRRLSGV